MNDIQMFRVVLFLLCPEKFLEALTSTVNRKKILSINVLHSRMPYGSVSRGFHIYFGNRGNLKIEHPKAIIESKRCSNRKGWTEWVLALTYTFPFSIIIMWRCSVENENKMGSFCSLTCRKSFHWCYEFPAIFLPLILCSQMHFIGTSQSSIYDFRIIDRVHKLIIFNETDNFY